MPQIRSFLVLFFVGIGAFFYGPILQAESASKVTTCDLPAPAKIISKVSWKFQFPNSPVLDSATLPTQASYRSFRDWANLQPNLHNPIEKLQAELDAYKNIGELTADISSRVEPIIEGKMGILRPVSCLEALLMAEANGKKSMPAAPYEIEAFVLSRTNSTGLEELIIYEGMGEATSVGDERGDFDSQMQNDLKNGWKMKFHIHNHPFSLEKPYDLNGGYTAPSQGDTDYYRQLSGSNGLPEARITNGVFTLVLKDKEFLQLP